MLGVKSDILVANGGIGSSRSDINKTWNGDFVVEGKVYEGYYLIEMKIPFSTLNYPENSKSWRFNFFRFDTEENQRTTWANIPQEFKIYNLAFMGKIIFERPLNKSKGKTWLIPFVNGFTEKDYSENNQNINEKVIMVGFSSSSLFSARFTFLHPERVSVAIGGGIGGLLPVPADKINGIEAIYPIGTYDFENITGTKFNLEEYKKTPQFYYQGTKDKSNPFRRGAEDLTDEEYEIVKKLFVDGLPFEDKPVSLKVSTAMWNNSQKYINQIVDNVKFESPKNLNHKITPKMTSKSTEFIKENLN